MDYGAFYRDVVAWIGQVNEAAMKLGMSNAPKGVQTYTVLSFERLLDFEILKDDLKRLSVSEATRYLIALDFGLNHKESRLFGLGMEYLERELAKKKREEQQ
ncbi:hypothetical protein MHH57_13745 [Paenibacillus sp. FSL H7-0442]|uniref:hypothetical protein n=1 Tax=Paenibacillus sp. FSL H7-0442 TaxID=2921435 RepID=UPI003157F225